MNIVVVVAGGCVTEAISNFFEEILLVFSIILSKGFGVFLKFNIELVKKFSRAYF